MAFSTKFIAAASDYTTFTHRVSAPYLRRSFTVSAEPAKAELTICGLGFYDLFINGERITKGILAPYISNPDDVLYYDEYDLKKYLRAGENVIGVILGNGMLNCPGGEIWDFEKAVYRSAPKLALSLDIDGNIIEADSSFKTAPSPITFNDLRVGEFYDARCEIDGWSKPGFDDSEWSAAIPAETPRGVCRICGADPIAAREEIKPVSIKRGAVNMEYGIRPGLPEVAFDGVEGDTEGWLYDFGVNAAGLCRLKIKGSAGQKIVMQFGEEIGPDGKLDLRGMSFLPRALNHRDIYICRGGDEEVYIPRFTYHGFRYCLVLGMTDAQATPDALTYVVHSSALEVNAAFNCSDEVVNSLWKAGIVSNLANFYYFPTDCPHREKNGWTGDAALSSEQMLVTLSPERSYHEWLYNIRRAQNDEGALPGIVPTSGWGFAWGNGPAWDIVIANLPYYTYLYRGDKKILEENATAIMRYLDYVSKRADKNGLIHIGLGDWCPVARVYPISPLEFTDTVTILDFVDKARYIFGVLGYESQRAFADDFYNRLRAAARERLIDKNTLIALGDCQTSQAMAIYYNVFDNAEKKAAFDILVSMIEKNDGHMDVGILGARVIFHVLSQFGRAELAYKMIARTDFPSYGNWIARGATSLWEDFQPDGSQPNSRNHHFFGDILSWFIKNLAGIVINPSKQDIYNVDICPKFVSQLDNASGSEKMPYGTIKSAWKRDGDVITLDITAPQDVYGSIKLEHGFAFENGTSLCALASGTYKIRAK